LCPQIDSRSDCRRLVRKPIEFEKEEKEDSARKDCMLL
jgi:hypothetical protein